MYSVSFKNIIIIEQIVLFYYLFHHFEWIICFIRDIRIIAGTIIADTYGDKNIQFVSVWKQSGRRCSYNYDCIYSFVFVAITGFV